LGLLLGFIAACTSEATGDDPASEDALILDLDPRTADPGNRWMRGVSASRLAIGEEVILPGEEQEFAAIAKTLQGLQDRLAAKNGGVGRTFHQKGHACVLGELHVAVPPEHPELKVGLFATDATYPTWLRFSNGVGFTQRDKAGDARGLALKVMKVPGKKLLAGSEDATTQDFLGINSSVQPASNVSQFLEFGKAVVDSELAGADPRLHVADDLAVAFPGVDFGPLNRLFSIGGFMLQPQNARVRSFTVRHLLPAVLKGGSVLGQEYFSGASIAFGVASGDPMTARAKQAAKFKMAAGVLDHGVCRDVKQVPLFADEDYLKSDLAARIKRSDVCVDFLVQLQRDPAKQLIEDTSVDWQESDAPFVKVGHVVVPRTDLESEDATAKEESCRQMGFTPWHTLPEHRPLGNMMRARRVVYEASREHRSGVKEPTGDGPR
jgi:hypothetical protein